MNKPLIGVLPLWDKEDKNYYIRPNYISLIERCGGIGVVLPITYDEAAIRQLASSFDGFLFTGGPDVNPSFYNETISPYCEYISDERDGMELKLLPEVMKLNKPIFGICRGMQLINVGLGGSLYQDIPQEINTCINHRQDKPYERYSHEVTLIKDSFLYDLLKEDKISVNSMHHQALKEVSKQLEVMAYSSDGIVEAIKHKTYPYLVALQWHPEFLFESDINSIKIFSSFIDICKRR